MSVTMVSPLALAWSFIRARTLSSMAVRVKSVSSSVILPASILEIQDVVEDAEQVLGGSVYLGQPFEVGGIPGVALEQIGEPQDGIHGVRISWLMLARKALLAWLALSARWWAWASCRVRSLTISSRW